MADRFLPHPPMHIFSPRCLFNCFSLRKERLSVDCESKYIISTQPKTKNRTSERLTVILEEDKKENIIQKANMTDIDDLLDAALDDDESVGEMLQGVKKGGQETSFDDSLGDMLNDALDGTENAGDEHDDMLDDILESPKTPKKASAEAEDDEDDMLDDLLASPKAEESPKRSVMVPDLPQSTSNDGNDNDDDLSDALHGNLDDLDLGDFEQVEESPKKEEDEAPSSPQSPPAMKSEADDAPFSPDSFENFLDDALDSDDKALAAPELPKSKPPAPAPAPKKSTPTPKKKTTPKPKATPRTTKTPPARKPVRKVADDKPVGDVGKKKTPKKPISFLSRSSRKATKPAEQPKKEKKGVARKIMSTIRPKPKPKTPKTPRTPPRSTRKKTIGAASPARSVCSVTSKDEPRSASSNCDAQFQPFLHSFRAPCDLCVHYLSEEERIMLDATGRSLRVMYTAGGCCRECHVFPRTADQAPVRLCRQCFFNSHRACFQKFALEQNLYDI